MTIDDLKANDWGAEAFGMMVPEILALVEALAAEEADRFQGSVFCPDSIMAYRAFNTKLAQL